MAEQLTGDRCPTCNGSKTVIANIGTCSVEVDCDKCAGTGVVNSPNACTECRGSGHVVVLVDGLNIQARCDHCNGSGLEPKTAVAK